MGIEDTDLTQESLAGYLDIFRQFHSSRILLEKCHLTREKLIMIAQDCRRLDIQVLIITFIFLIL